MLVMVMLRSDLFSIRKNNWFCSPFTMSRPRSHLSFIDLDGQSGNVRPNGLFSGKYAVATTSGSTRGAMQVQKIQNEHRNP
jgi:hypothetical protein